MLEPRRIAAVSAARWMAKMLKEEIGETIVYSIRYDSRTSEITRILRIYPVLAVKRQEMFSPADTPQMQTDV
jgi:hypothetical protein